MLFRRSKAVSGAPSQPSLMGTLFRPHFGRSLKPFQENNRIFLRLVAGVFALYGLFPKDHPAFKDEAAKLTLREIIATGWNRVEFTRAGLPRAIMFFAVLGIMIFSAVAAVIALLAIFSAHAHAADTNLPGASAFQPESNDLAQSWINYLFLNTGGASFPTFSDTFGDGSASMNDPFAGSVSLQGALISALAFYSEAILVVAAFILFYHLTSMVVETAHDGVVMGKRANQVWAPIRLVVAIGLLVPVNGGLNCGQFIVIKMAELGSGLASQTWDLFVQQLLNYNTQGVPPRAPAVAFAALHFVEMQACQMAWNRHVDEAVGGNLEVSSLDMNGPTVTQTNIGNIPGTKYSFSGNEAGEQDICGWYFIPSNSSNTLAAQAATYQQNAISASQKAFSDAANEMNNILATQTSPGSTPPGNGTAYPALDDLIYKAISQYQQNLNQQIGQMNQNQGNLMQDALNKLKPYGWVMAGATLNTIDRMQGGMITAASDSLPDTHPPKLEKVETAQGGMFAPIMKMFGYGSDNDITIHNSTATDMNAFEKYVGASLNRGTSDNSDAQCAAMVGLSTGSANGGWGPLNKLADYVLGMVDSLAAANGVWNTNSGVSCGGSPSPSGNSTFTLGIQFNSTDPFAQMAFLGHSNLNMAATLLAMSFGSSIGGTLLSAVGGIASALGGGFLSGAGTMLGFLALIFFMCGFFLAYMIPLLPFLRFFFSVISWVGGLIEAVIAVPLVALAHLNPEGAGLPGQAKSAYNMVFSLFLRPVLMIFGFICGYIVFLVALSFLNYAYGVAVAGAGGTAYGHAALSRIVFSILYVGIVYTCANHSFALIDHLPENAMKWMGAEGMRFPQMGDAGKIEGIAGLISQYAGSQVMQQVGTIGNQLAKPTAERLSGKKAPDSDSNPNSTNHLGHPGPAPRP